MAGPPHPGKGNLPKDSRPVRGGGSGMPQNMRHTVT